MRVRCHFCRRQIDGPSRMWKSQPQNLRQLCQSRKQRHATRITDNGRVACTQRDATGNLSCQRHLIECVGFFSLISTSTLTTLKEHCAHTGTLGASGRLKHSHIEELLESTVHRGCKCPGINASYSFSNANSDGVIPEPQTTMAECLQIKELRLVEVSKDTDLTCGDSQRSEDRAR